MGAVGGTALGSFGTDWLGGPAGSAAAAAPIGANDGVLVTIMLYGGNDGLNTVVPYADSTYYTQRGNVAIAANQVLALDANVGLHPNLGFMKSLYDGGDVAVVQGVGYPNPDLSHFTSMAVWMAGRFGNLAPSTGWIGRWLDGLSAPAADLAAATIDSSVALHLIGEQRRAVAISPYGDMFGSETSDQDVRMYNGMRALSSTPGGRGPWHDMFATTLRTQLDTAAEVASVFDDGLPENVFAKKLTIAARLINADVGLRVVDVSLDGFDNHDAERADHDQLMSDLDSALRAFYATLLPQHRDRVTLLTMSEFGRTLYANDSGGTDHGTASDMFVIGPKVVGGLYGAQPRLAGLGRWDRPVSTVDFRSVLGTVVDGWLGGGGSTIVNGSFENLGLFSGGPSAVGPRPVVVLPPASPSGLVAVSPTRIIDTRDGTGGRSTPLGAQETWKFAVAPRFGVPADAVAVALNVTTTDATQPTFVTVHPFGELRPLSSNLNPVPGKATPNLVISRVGVDGAIELFNNAGAVNVVADLVGWFTVASTVGLVPLDPARLLDTRDGAGGTLGAVTGGSSIDVQVAGRGGVPANAVAVALNVTATEPTAASYLTVWPAGEGRPLASSVNMAPGETVANMVIARLGSGGRLSVYNNGGSSHVVIDVLGAFVPGAPARFVPVSPSRVVDTREGVGAPRARVERADVGVPLVGRGGVPAGGAAAVLMNVTAVSPSTGTYVTVYPAGKARPLASNLNANAGQVVPNMVLARLGTGGAAVLYNNSGSIDLVADVMGYFTG
jgi:uncharacterized protein (DUF1501 family)